MSGWAIALVATKACGTEFVGGYELPIAVAALTTSLALLSKASSVTFVLPMLTYTAVALAVKRDRIRLSSGPTDIAFLILAAVTATAAVAWYYVNWHTWPVILPAP